MTLTGPAPEQLRIGDVPRILVADPIAEDGVARLRLAGDVDVATGLSPDELAARIGDYDALVVRSETKVTAPILERATRLRVVGRAGVGVDNIDLDAATRHGVMVLNAPTGNTIAAAEHAVALMMALARNVAAADRSMHEGRWERSRFVGVELREKTLGLLGLGKIGYEVARIASQGLQMRVLAHDPLVAPDRAEQAGAQLCDLDTLLRESDVLSVHVPLTDATRGVIGAAELRRLRRGAMVLNVARGGIIDEAALAHALEDGHLGGAAIDVYTREPIAEDNPLRHAPRALLTPHLGASTHEAQINVAFDVADQIVQVLSGQPARYAVNAPALLPEELHALRPYLELATRLGSLAAQLTGGEIRAVRCTYTGELAGFDTVVLTAEALRGVLGSFTETRVNPINARLVAQQHGIAVEERRTSQRGEYAGSMRVEIEGARTVAVEGTHFGDEPHITRIDDFRVDMQPQGTFLVGSHADRPGVIAHIATLLAQHDVNIAGIELGRDHPRGRAVMLMQIDERIRPELLAELQRTAGLETLREIVL